MEVFKLLEANLFVEKVGTPEQIEDLKSQALWHRENEPNMMAFSNNGCWRSEFKYKNHNWLIKSVMDLTERAIEYYSLVDPTFTEKKKYYRNPQIKYWTNVNEPGSKNSLHNHDLQHFVGCYYLQSENTGNLTFYNPANLLENCHPFSPFVSRMAYVAKEGDLLIWPGWMPHETEVNFSDKQRINIAFNIRYETPQGTAR